MWVILKTILWILCCLTNLINELYIQAKKKLTKKIYYNGKHFNCHYWSFEFFKDTITTGPIIKRIQIWYTKSTSCLGSQLEIIYQIENGYSLKGKTSISSMLPFFLGQTKPICPEFRNLRCFTGRRPHKSRTIARLLLLYGKIIFRIFVFVYIFFGLLKVISRISLKWDLNVWDSLIL